MKTEHNQALQPQQQASPALRFNVTLPVTKLGFGPFQFDPLTQIVGQPIANVLEPLRVGDVTRRPSTSGTAVEVHPLALPDGEGLVVPLGQFGELGFRASSGYLVLTVPAAVKGWVGKRLEGMIVKGPTEATSLNGTARVAEFWVQLRPGARASVPLGMLGEIGVEAA